MNTCDNILSSTLVKLLRVVASIALCSLAFFLVSCDRSNKHSGESLPAIHLDTPWDVSELFKAPQYRWVDTQSPVHALIYQGLDYKGNLVDVFAYYSTPGVYFHKPETDKDLPGIVLVHGGWGRADHQWVAMWAKRGYAAIAMDLDGKGPDQSRMVNAGPPEKTYLTADWNYHAVAKIILAHSLIRSFQEVDETRTGITGISVGGHLTMTVLGLDTRFAAAVPVYGCGYLHEIDQWNRSDLYTKLSEEEKCAWATLYDPSNYLNYATTPVLFIAGTNDSYYPLNTLVQTYL
ncbi:MAG TPA: hypothetical protein ENN05_04800, partial [Deltaproteobacteria bacterium]|nr:hypothetical protein [Deltaproteobacteria bacterium]